MNIAIWGYYGFANVGDEAILACMLEELQRTRLGGNVTVYSGNPKNTQQSHRVQAVSGILPDRFIDRVIRSLGRGRVEYFRSLKAFKKADLIIVGGGGLFFDGPDQNIYLRNLVNRIGWALKLKKKVAIIAVGVGPLHHESSRKIIRQVFQRVNLITVREQCSYDLLEQIDLGGATIHVAADLAFLLKPAPSEQLSEVIPTRVLARCDGPVVAVSLNGRHIDRPGYAETMVGFCNYLITKYDAHIWFVPLQTYREIDDRIGMQAIMERIEYQDRVFLFDGEYSPQVVLSLLNRADVVLGEKFHAAIFSVINGRPVMGIAYMPKVARLFADLNHPEWCVDIDELDTGRLISVFDDIWSNRTQVSAELCEFARKMKSKAMSNLDLLYKVLRD